MKQSIARRSAVLAIGGALALSLTACSSSSTSGDSSTGTASSAPSAAASSMSSAPSTMSSDSASASASASGDAMAASAPFGPGCSAVPTSGPGSFEGMSTAPVATAASNNPVLSTLVTAVKKANLVDTLNSAKDITVIAPADPAFKAIPDSDLQAVLADNKKLTSILTAHVISGRLSPDQLAGSHQTLGGGTVTIDGSGQDFTIAGSETITGQPAHVICGNVQTANATVYIVDQVLKPSA